MLDSLRKYATSWVAQLLLGLLVISFSVWGVSDIFTGYRSNDIATVGSASVTIADYQRSYQSALDRITQQTGQVLTPQQAQQAGIPQQIISQLVSQASLDDAAKAMKLGVSDEALGKAIAENPQFLDSSGKFDPQYLRLVIRSLGYTEDTFIMDQRRSVLRSQLAQAFGVGIGAPETYLRAVSDYRGETRDISYLVLTAPDAGTVAEPSDTDLGAYYESHKDAWKTAELRAFNFFEVSPEALAAPTDVTDDDARARYDANQTRFTRPEKRNVQQIVFKDRADAAAAAKAIADGKTFEDIATERGLKPTDFDLGLVTEDKILDKKIAEAAFGLGLNTVSPVVDGSFGPALVRVTNIEAGSTTSFEDARADLKKEIAEERAAADVTTLHDSIEDARAGGATLAEAAEKFGLKLVAVPALDASGKDIDGKDGPALPQGLLAAVFDTDMGMENDPVRTGQSAWAWYEVTAVTDPHERPLADVRDKVIAAWKDDQRAEKLAATAAKAKERLLNKEDIAAVASDLGVSVQKLAGITRIGALTGDMSAAAQAAAFDGPKGLVTIADSDKPLTKILIVVDDVHAPEYNAEDDFLKQTKQQLDAQFVNDLLNLYATELRARTKVRYNQVALQSVLGAVGN